MQHYGDNFIPVIPADEAVHTSERPFCSDETCPCHDDPDAIALVDQAYQDGLITAEHATEIVRGNMPW